jgi:alkanesulfonate monooxygenase SsuD/methylene tetrahydromethanopterin reductase-like flavin-dependent oxidoreductase (luciferase family)
LQIGTVLPNTYRDTRALCAVGLLEHTMGKVTPRWMYDAEAGRANMRTTLDMAREIDELGFDHVSVSEHHYFPLIATPNAAVFAAALSQVVRCAKIAFLGPIVSVSNPVKVAEEIAMLDQLTGGDRLLVYLLKGTPNEHQYYGMQWDEARARSQEAALLIKKALTEPEQFAWHGQFWDFPVVSVWPGATTKGHPPIYTSGSQPETFEFAAATRTWCSTRPGASPRPASASSTSSPASAASRSTRSAR